MDRKRPDYPAVRALAGLTAEASRLDILSRSGGEQKGDSVYLAEAPAVADDGATEAIFLARGVSYAVREYDTAARAGSLRAGDDLVSPMTTRMRRTPVPCCSRHPTERP